MPPCCLKPSVWGLDTHFKPTIRSGVAQQAERTEFDSGTGAGSNPAAGTKK